ncbi:hydroxymethylpyrimidine/phosphomethylpyrimidine kinase [Comamonas sp. J-3]|jgi:hydroxymethylpyrimidine/phosphomethylpyrimidine kinase|uniref:bifunctional hydroxymethylpyrimidine kinase/phosphomethylpyrimidine kinase n=1 Tax=Comamonas trifloxystrobinivorans TaxID=3350256 RepID=UPI003728F242
MTSSTTPTVPESIASESTLAASIDTVSVLCINANDPSGAGGINGDSLAVASMGAHPCTVVTGSLVRDTLDTLDFYPLPDDAVQQQAQAVLQDIPIRAIKIGFLGSIENIRVCAEITNDYSEVPVVAYLSSMAWWDGELIDDYLDAYQELLLPQVTLLVGAYGLLWRWLLPDRTSERPPTPRDIARAAAEKNVPFVLVTGIPTHHQHVENVLASADTIYGSGEFELFETEYIGAGDTLSAALTALLATEVPLSDATAEAMTYLDKCLEGGLRPGMGKTIPDRLFWVHAGDDDDEADEASEQDAGAAATPGH